ncbi:MAG: N-acetyl-gamma-glutamyl-phosphate reductase [Proteobacteria bacterium]|nr:N-acetyl-gamma-glutamyl-phosphate reductase [Pseudomonadota bacterium]
MDVAIIGAAGYTGVELCRLLAFHPQAKITGLFEARFLGKPVSELFPHLRGQVDLPLRPFSLADVIREAQVVFCGLPHGKSLEVVPPLIEAGLKVIDLSADFRFADPKVYATWYQNHTAPGLLAQAVYGLPEIFREKIRPAQLVANPGCYPTSVLLPLIPLARRGLIQADSVIANSLSGTSGAGRTPNPELLFCEVTGGLKAYSVGTHRHAPEIETYLSVFSPAPVRILFVPHLMPIPRGILSTICFQTTRTVGDQDIYQFLQEDYQKEPFVRVLPPGLLPNTRNVVGSNLVEIGIKHDPRTGKTVLVSALDNLIKGAAGQAVQNLNLLFGIPETTGLQLPVVFP